MICFDIATTQSATKLDMAMFIVLFGMKK